MLARAVSKLLGVPCRRLLYREHGAAQTGRTRSERLRGPSFRALSPRAGLHVLLVDDVVTTGATMHAAAQALRTAGIAHVQCIAAAATPAHNAARLRTVATAGNGSTSTNTPYIPNRSEAATLVGTSSKNAVRPAAAPSLARAS